MRHETARQRHGPRAAPRPLGEHHPLGGDIPPQFTIQAWSQLRRADPGPSRVGPFSLLRTRRNLPITIAKTTRGN